MNLKKNKFALPPDVSFFIDFCRAFKKEYKVKENTKIIVPCLNKEFKEDTIQNIHFVKIDKIEEFITTIKESNKTDISSTFEEIKKKMIVPKKKRGIFKERNVSVL